MSRRGAKKITDSQHKGDGGIGLIHMLIYEMGHVWHDRVVDAGIDGSIELRDPATSEMTNQHVMVQSKASDEKFAGESDGGFWYLCAEEDIEYWMKSKDTPVVLICSHPKERKAWWVHVQPWFDVPANRASRRIDFNKATQAFEGDFTGKLFAIVDPHGVAHTPVAEKKREWLYSNLVPVDVPDLLYVAQANHTQLRAAFEAQRESGLAFRSDFVLKSGRIYLWGRPEDTSLESVIAGQVSAIPFSELVAGDADERRLAVWLLNAALQHDLRADCRWNNDRKFLHFRATQDLSERRVTSTSGRERLVFKGYYQRKDDPSRPQFYRHAALRTQFSRVGEEWVCEITPDYFYTEDGYAESKFADKNLARMKRRERNQARLSETLMWVSFLMGETAPDLFYEAPERLLDFGPPVRFQLDRGITDKHWTAPNEDSGDNDGLSENLADEVAAELADQLSFVDEFAEANE